MFVRRITHPLLILLAIVFLIEAWLWSHLEPIVAWIVGIIPLRRLKALLKRFLEWLPPAAALIAFVVPGLLLFPLKLAAVWLITQNHWFAASAVFLFAKLAGLGVAAFIFEVTKPQLLQMAGSAGSTGACWSGSTGRTASPTRSRNGFSGCRACSRPDGAGGRCGCCGASAAAA